MTPNYNDIPKDGKITSKWKNRQIETLSGFMVEWSRSFWIELRNGNHLYIRKEFTAFDDQPSEFDVRVLAATQPLGPAWAPFRESNDIPVEEA